MAKRKINARELAGDVKSGLSYRDLLDRYSLTEASLDRMLEKLVEVGLIERSQLPKRSGPKTEPLASSQPLQDQDSSLVTRVIPSFKCPKCGTVHIEGDRVCVKCGIFFDDYRPDEAEPEWECLSCGAPREKQSGICPTCGMTAPGIARHRGATSHDNISKSEGRGISRLALNVAVILVFLAPLALYFYIDSRSVQAILNNSKGTEVAQSSNQPEAVPESAIRVNEEDLFYTYRDNEVKADQKYRNKVLQVQGMIHEIGKTYSGDIAIALWIRHPSQYEKPKAPAVICIFSSSPEDEERIGRLSPGDTVTVEGRCIGKRTWDIVLNGCRLVR